MDYVLLGKLVLLLVAGFIAGVVNTLAGGGSFLTIPALMLYGMDVSIANGTNRVAVLLQSGTATGIFHKAGKVDLRSIARILPANLLGAVIGAVVASWLPADVFRVVFGVIFIGMTVVMIAKRKLMLAAEREPIRATWLTQIVFFAIGFYGGFIQAGVGLLILLGMSLCMGKELVQSNGAKVALAFLFTAPALAIFAWQGQVLWIPGLVLAVGNVAGAVLGAKLAISKGNKLIMGAVVVVMLATAVKLLWPTGH
jgi:uncharacterized membrane protein YfcA